MAIPRRLLHRLRSWQPGKSLTDPLILENLGMISFGAISMLLASARACSISFHRMVAMWHTNIHCQTPQMCVVSASTLLPMHAQLLEACAYKSLLRAESCRVRCSLLLEQDSHGTQNKTDSCSLEAGRPKEVLTDRSYCGWLLTRPVSCQRRDATLGGLSWQLRLNLAH